MDSDLLLVGVVAVVGLAVASKLGGQGAITLPAPPSDSVGGLPANATQGPAQGLGSSAFNFNDRDTTASYSENSGQLSAHAGFGHVGPGGTYTLRLDAHDTGFLGAIGAQPWISVDAVQVRINDDADWAGYGFDFLDHLDRGLFSGLEVRLSIYTDTNVLVQSKIVGVSVGF
jgi:hypothetical protein